MEAGRGRSLAGQINRGAGRTLKCPASESAASARVTVVGAGQLPTPSRSLDLKLRCIRLGVPESQADSAACCQRHRDTDSDLDAARASGAVATLGTSLGLLPVRGMCSTLRVGSQPVRNRDGHVR